MRTVLGVLALFAGLGLAPSAAGQAAGTALRLGSHYSYSHSTFALDSRGAGRVEFAPRVSPRPGVEADYRGFGFAASLPASHGTSAGRDPGEWNDFRAHWHGDRWGIEAYHRRARGFEAMAEAAGTPPVSRPDVRLQVGDLAVYRSFDPDSRVHRLSRGLDATGGAVDFFLMLSASRTQLRADRPFLPEGRDSRFAGMRAVDVTAAGLGGGYALSGNLAGLYVEQALFAGYGPQYRVFGDESDWTWNLVKVNLRLRLGVRTPWFDAGAGFENDAQAALAGKDRLMAHALVARAGIEVFL